MLEKEKIKLEKERLEVEREKAHAAIMQADTARMQAMSDVSQSVTRKMKEESRILTADLSAYTPKVQAWFKINQQRILCEMGVLPPEPTPMDTTGQPTPTTTPMDTTEGESTTTTTSSDVDAAALPRPGWEGAIHRSSRSSRC